FRLGRSGAGDDRTERLGFRARDPADLGPRRRIARDQDAIEDHRHGGAGLLRGYEVRWDMRAGSQTAKLRRTAQQNRRGSKEGAGRTRCTGGCSYTRDIRGVAAWEQVNSGDGITTLPRRGTSAARPNRLPGPRSPASRRSSGRLAGQEIASRPVQYLHALMERSSFVTDLE